MNKTRTLKRKSSIVFLFFSILFFTPAISSGVNLIAAEGIWEPPGGGSAVKMWGFIPDLDFCPSTPMPWTNGPTQKGVVNGTLSITLRNCLSEPVSLIIPGLQSSLSPQTFVDSKGRIRVRAFAKEVPANHGLTAVTYTWTNLRAGTYLYQSGSHPAKQVPMGLYGAVTIGIHPDADNDAIVLFSEIDPALHSNADASTPLNYKPKYFLINGQSALPGSPPPSISIGKYDKTLQIRFLNAGLMTHVPTLQGPYMQLVAEDGNPYPYPKKQYSVMLAAGKTIDALWNPNSTEAYSIYDRRLSMTTNGKAGGGMIQQFDISGFPWILFAPAMSH